MDAATSVQSLYKFLEIILRMQNMFVRWAGVPSCGACPSHPWDLRSHHGPWIVAAQRKHSLRMAQ